MATRKPNNTDLREGEEHFTDEDKGTVGTAVEPVNMSRVNPTFIPDSWDEAIAHLQETDGVVEFEGSPWHVVDKRHLVGKPFIILGWGTAQGDRGLFTSLMAMTQEAVPDENGQMVNRVVINDGGTGIHAQWQAIVISGKGRVGTVVKNGLRVSEYDHPEHGPSKTYYLG